MRRGPKTISANARLHLSSLPPSGHITAGLAVGFPLVLLGCILATRQSRAGVPALAEP